MENNKNMLSYNDAKNSKRFVYEDSDDSGRSRRYVESLKLQLPSIPGEWMELVRRLAE